MMISDDLVKVREATAHLLDMRKAALVFVLLAGCGSECPVIDHCAEYAYEPATPLDCSATTCDETRPTDAICAAAARAWCECHSEPCSAEGFRALYLFCVVNHDEESLCQAAYVSDAGIDCAGVAACEE